MRIPISTEKTLTDVPASLLCFALDDDGGFRDLNFTGVTPGGLPPFLELLAEDFEFESASQSGNPLLDPDWPNVFERLVRNTGSLHLCYQTRARLVSELQVFIAFEEESLYIELSFAPTDVIAGTTSIALFSWFRALQAAASADDFFFRYEDGGWEEGDTGPTSLVVATSTWIAEWKNTV